MQFMGMSAGVITATGEGGGRLYLPGKPWRLLLLYGDDVIIRGCCVGGVIHRRSALFILFAYPSLFVVHLLGPTLTRQERVEI